MKGRRVTRRKKKRPARGTRRGGGIFNFIIGKNSLLIQAVRDGNKLEVERLLKNGASVKAVDKFGLTALMWAARYGQASIVEVLLAAGADVNAAVPKGHPWCGVTALILAARHGHASTVELLLAAGADVGAGRPGRTSLMWAAAEGHTNVVDILKNAANKKAAGNQKAAAVPVPVPAQSSVPVQATLINNYGVSYATPLNKPKNGVPVAMAVGKPVITSFATPTANRVPNKKTLSNKNKEKLGLDLIDAVVDGNESEVKRLLAEGADVNAADGLGRTALMRAAERGHAPTVEVLLAAGADVDAANADGETALQFAGYYLKRGIIYKSIVELLLAAGANVNNVDKNGTTALIHAVKSIDNASTVELLLAAGADVNAANADGGALMAAIRYSGGQKSIVELLVAKGADVNAANKSGETALMIAEKYKFTDIVNILKAAKEKAVAMAVIKSFATPTANRVPNKKTLSNKK